MAVSNFTSLLGLALPTTGDLSGTWGDTVNASITSLLDSAIAGTTTLSADSNVTLSVTQGAANEARSAILNCTGARTAQRTIIAPPSSKVYVVVNSTTGGYGVKIAGTGPTTGVVVKAGEAAIVAWTGTDFALVASRLVDLTTNVTSVLPVANGGTGAATYTLNNVLLGNTTSAFKTVAPGTAGNVLTSDGVTWASSAPAATPTIASSNGFAGNITGGVMTLSTTVTGLTKGNGTALSAAAAGTDYTSPTGSESLTNKTLGTGCTWNGNAVPATYGGTGLTSISALSALVANSANTPISVAATAGQSLRVNAGGTAWEAFTPGTGSGSVTTVSVVTANGFAGSVATATTTPAITIRTSITGLLKGNGTSISAASAGTDYIAPSGALGTPSSGTLSNCTVDGTNDVGYLNIPQNSQSAAYTLVLSDAGKHVLHPSADTTARTYTIPANSSVAYPIGTALTFINQNGAGTVTISINTDTMRLAGAGTTGSRTLAANGVATAIKITSTEWIISGTNLS